MKPLIASLQNHCFENKKKNKQLMSKTYWSVIEAKSFSINFRVTGRLNKVACFFKIFGYVNCVIT